MSWARLHCPSTEDSLAVHPSKVAQVKSHLKAFVQSDAVKGPSKTPRIIVLEGQSGCGKWSSLEVVCNTLGLGIVEWDNPPYSSASSHKHKSLTTNEIGSRDNWHMHDKDGSIGEQFLRFLQQSKRFAPLNFDSTINDEVENIGNIHSNSHTNKENYCDQVEYIKSTSPVVKGGVENIHSNSHTNKGNYCVKGANECTVYKGHTSDIYMVPLNATRGITGNANKHLDRHFYNTQKQRTAAAPTPCAFNPNPSSSIMNSQPLHTLTTQNGFAVGVAHTAVCVDDTPELEMPGPCDGKHVTAIRDIPHSFLAHSPAFVTKLQIVMSEFVNYSFTVSIPQLIVFSFSQHREDQNSFRRMFTTDLLQHPSVVVVKFNAVAASRMRKALIRILHREGFDPILVPIDAIVCNAGGDLRSAICNMQFYCQTSEIQMTTRPPAPITLRAVKKKNRPSVTKPPVDELLSRNVKDLQLQLFNCLGRILYNKRIPRKPLNGLSMFDAGSIAPHADTVNSTGTNRRAEDDSYGSCFVSGLDKYFYFRSPNRPPSAGFAYNFTWPSYMYTEAKEPPIHRSAIATSTLQLAVTSYPSKEDDNQLTTFPPSSPFAVARKRVQTTTSYPRKKRNAVGEHHPKPSPKPISSKCCDIDKPCQLPRNQMLPKSNRGELYYNPDDIISIQSETQDLIYENYLDFYGRIDDVAEAAEQLAFVDSQSKNRSYIDEEIWSGVRCSLIIRSILDSNLSPIKPLTTAKNITNSIYQMKRSRMADMRNEIRICKRQNADRNKHSGGLQRASVIDRLHGLCTMSTDNNVLTPINEAVELELSDDPIIE